jgi:hypothetical protein
MNIKLTVLSLIVLAGAVSAPGRASAQTTRFSAQYASGKRLNGADIFDWQDEKADPPMWGRPTPSHVD